MAMMKYFGAFGTQAALLRKESGTVHAICGMLKAPLDILADKLRGYLGLCEDLLQRRECNVLRANRNQSRVVDEVVNHVREERQVLRDGHVHVREREVEEDPEVAAQVAAERDFPVAPLATPAPLDSADSAIALTPSDPDSVRLGSRAASACSIRAPAARTFAAAAATSDSTAWAKKAVEALMQQAAVAAGAGAGDDKSES